MHTQGITPQAFLSSVGYDHMVTLVRTSIAESFRVPSKQIPRVFFHGLILACVISGFWLLDSLKDPIFVQTVGIEYQPIAKLLSVVTTLIVVCIYDFLTTVVNKDNLFHVLAVFFGTIMLVIAALLTDENIGLPNRVKGPHRILGWVAYFSIEAYGSLMVALFWSFTNSLMNLEEAKGAYGLIISIAQIGAISGSTLATHSKDIGISTLFFIGGLLIYSISFLIKGYNIIFRTTSLSETIVGSSSSSSGSPPTSRSRDYWSPSLKARNSGDSFDDGLDEIWVKGRKSVDVIYEGRLEERGMIRDRSDKGDRSDRSDRSDRGKKEKSDEDIALLNDSTRTTLYKHSYTSLAYYIESCEVVASTFVRVFAGFYEGLSLIKQHGYMARVLGVSCLYEIVVTILDYEFKLLGNSSAENAAQKKYMSNVLHGDKDILVDSFEGIDSGDYFAVLLGHFGQFTNVISFLVSFFGFSYIVEKLGVKKTLLVFPITLLVTVIVVHLVPTLWVFFVFVSIIKAMIFSLQDPTKELLYMPTSEAIKFKAKAWIDVFGSRFAKAVGSVVTNMSGGNASSLRKYSEIPCLLIAAGIVVLSWVLGTEFELLVYRGVVVGAQDAYTEEVKISTSVRKKFRNTMTGEHDGPMRNGLMPGDVGYDGYDLHLFEGVEFEVDSVIGSGDAVDLSIDIDPGSIDLSLSIEPMENPMKS